MTSLPPSHTHPSLWKPPVCTAIPSHQKEYIFCLFIIYFIFMISSQSTTFFTATLLLHFIQSKLCLNLPSQRWTAAQNYSNILATSTQLPPAVSTHTQTSEQHRLVGANISWLCSSMWARTCVSGVISAAVQVTWTHSTHGILKLVFRGSPLETHGILWVNYNLQTSDDMLPSFNNILSRNKRWHTKHKFTNQKLLNP